MDKAGPSPYSTGGGGRGYGRTVGATYLDLMACGTAAPGVDGMVAAAEFRRRGAGRILDDRVAVSSKGGSAHRLSLQVRRGLRVGTSSEFKYAIAGCLRVHVGGGGIAFDQSVDLLEIVAPRTPVNTRRHGIPPLSTARIATRTGHLGRENRTPSPRCLLPPRFATTKRSLWRRRGLAVKILRQPRMRGPDTPTGEQSTKERDLA